MRVAHGALPQGAYRYEWGRCEGSPPRTSLGALQVHWGGVQTAQLVLTDLGKCAGCAAQQCTAATYFSISQHTTVGATCSCHGRAQASYTLSGPPRSAAPSGSNMGGSSSGGGGGEDGSSDGSGDGGGGSSGGSSGNATSRDVQVILLDERYYRDPVPCQVCIL